MRIRRTAMEAIVAHAQAAVPAECCGMLIGDANGIVEAVPARNLSADPNRFHVDPKDHIDARRNARARNLAVVGFYHSHPHSAPVPSATDRAEASYPGVVHLIISLECEPPQGRAFTMIEGGVQEIPLAVD